MREVDEYLRCGLLEHGCVRVGCCRCGFERLVLLVQAARLLPLLDPARARKTERSAEVLGLNVHADVAVPARAAPSSSASPGQLRLVLPEA